MVFAVRREIIPRNPVRTEAMLLANVVGVETAADVLGLTSTVTTNAHHAGPDRSVNSVAPTVLQRLAPRTSRTARRRRSVDPLRASRRVRGER